ncbi:MAG: TetR/AcrR family transcriptional regulator [Ruminococcus flavefaciens]|nr:TetR/AcrR family transcriptional regulator [Ruminococcus flavefaciens]MCM1230917.1 TetR/AcrR family transcriptional regulator [Ruminococcus flavefaciens]
MRADRETKEKLLASAKKEFLEKGYTKASLRKICADVGVTTGALYFFFEGKEDLFAAIVKPPLDTLTEVLTRHFVDDISAMSAPGFLQQYTSEDDEAVGTALVHHIYQNHDAFMLLLTKSQGSRFENCVDNLVDLIEKSYREMADRMASQKPGYRVNEYMRHWFTHMNVDAFIHLLTHEKDEQNAIRHMKQIMNYLVKGWMEMILISEEVTDE